MDANGTQKPYPEADQMSAKDLIVEENSAAANNTINTNTASQEKNIKAADDKANLTVGGFLFHTPEDAEVARAELNKIEYLEKKMNYHLPENILAVYNKVMESKMLKTPLGIHYLYRMQTHMHKVGIDQDRIAPIPVYQNFAPKVPGEVTEGIARQRIERRLKKEKSESQKMKTRFHGAIAACLILVGLVGLMFYVTLKSDNPNILNYEQNLINKYANWDQELTERERSIREKERRMDGED